MFKLVLQILFKIDVFSDSNVIMDDIVKIKSFNKLKSKNLANILNTDNY